MSFPQNRLRRLRTSPAMRRLVHQTRIDVDDLVYPLFVKDGAGLVEPIKSMPGCSRFSPDTLVTEANDVASLGIPAVLLFGSTSKKDKTGSAAWDEDGSVQQAVKAIKKAVPQLVVITDVCLCSYTDTGHCGIVKDDRIDNDETCHLLAKIALSHAQAGADIVAPSDMMDGRIEFIREALEKNAFHETAIMSYSAKFASAFYGPFRDAADSTPAFGDRKSYQLDPANDRQAMNQISLDIEQGADIVMVKPALPFLDIIYRARQRFDVPIAAYNVSGEYMMINSAADTGSLERDAAIMETLCSIKRAGADIIITYFAKSAAKLLT
ncbi:MAG: porphobilinogen synthase [Phycisphaerae bacterium]|nr:porphobilinogen synthase [Phycisphaerae bacterium]